MIIKPHHQWVAKLGMLNAKVYVATFLHVQKPQENFKTANMTTKETKNVFCLSRLAFKVVVGLINFPAWNHVTNFHTARHCAGKTFRPHLERFSSSELIDFISHSFYIILWNLWDAINYSLSTFDRRISFCSKVTCCFIHCMNWTAENKKKNLSLVSACWSNFYAFQLAYETVYKFSVLKE